MPTEYVKQNNDTISNRQSKQYYCVHNSVYQQCTLLEVHKSTSTDQYNYSSGNPIFTYRVQIGNNKQIYVDELYLLFDCKEISTNEKSITYTYTKVDDPETNKEYYFKPDREVDVYSKGKLIKIEDATSNGNPIKLYTLTITDKNTTDLNKDHYASEVYKQNATRGGGKSKRNKKSRKQKRRVRKSRRNRRR